MGQVSTIVKELSSQNDAAKAMQSSTFPEQFEEVCSKLASFKKIDRMSTTDYVQWFLDVRLDRSHPSRDADEKVILDYIRNVVYDTRYVISIN